MKCSHHLSSTGNEVCELVFLGGFRNVTFYHYVSLFICLRATLQIQPQALASIWHLTYLSDERASWIRRGVKHSQWPCFPALGFLTGPLFTLLGLCCRKVCDYRSRFEVVKESCSAAHPALFTATTPLIDHWLNYWGLERTKWSL